MSTETVVVLGASPKPERYSNKAIRMLRDHGHTVVPVHPVHTEIEHIPAVHSLEEVTQKIDTVTVYVAPAHSAGMAGGIVALKPKRVILNPGTESESLKADLEKAGIEVVEGCTLVMLSTDQF